MITKTYLESTSSFIRSHHRKDLQDKYEYLSIEEYVLKHGMSFKSSSLTRAERVIVRAALTTWGQKPELGKCFYNAQMLVLHDATKSLIYTEGYGFQGVLPVHHAWVTIDEKVVDLTWKKLSKNRPMGTFSSKTEYIGVKFPEIDFLTRIMNAGNLCYSILNSPLGDSPLRLVKK